MELLINTIRPDSLELALRDNKKIIAQTKIKTSHNLSQKLWPALALLLKNNKIKLNNLKKIIVANGEGSFTSLRIGIAAANGLAYALNIPVADDSGKFKTKGGLRLAEPTYTHGANITNKIKPVDN